MLRTEEEVLHSPTKTQQYIQAISKTITTGHQNKPEPNEVVVAGSLKTDDSREQWHN